MLLACSLFTMEAQDIERLDKKTISECKTPESVAYNFIMAVIKEDYDKMEKLISPDLKVTLQNSMIERGFDNYSDLFNSILGSDVLVVARCEVLELGIILQITKKYTHSSSMYSEGGKEKELMSIIFNDFIIEANDRGETGEVAHITLECINGEWKVWSFK